MLNICNFLKYIFVDFFAGEVIDFNNLIIAIFEFVQSLIEHKKFSSLLNNRLQEIIHYLIIFMQITEEQIELWTTNPTQFIEKDEQCVFTYSVRISAQELLSVGFLFSIKNNISD